MSSPHFKSLPAQIALGFLVFACAGPAPQVSTPTLPLPAAWSAPLWADQEAPFQFLDQCGDPRLEDLIVEALGHNQNLLAAAQRVEAVAAQGVIARAGLYPSVLAGLDFQRNRRNYIGLPIPGIGDSVLTSTTSSWNSGLSASWEVDLWGRVRAGARAADADSRAARIELEGARLSLAGQVCRAWFALLEAHQQVRLAEETLASWERSERWARSRFDAGVGPALDLRLTAANTARARAGLLEVEQAKDLAARTLEVLLGRYPGGELSAADTFPEIPQPVSAGIPASLLGR
ncbi:MAG: TolC family protein, partial [Planctomycetota bacterium]|nr:TolC family protein [Planctomycetota bacterium]